MQRAWGGSELSVLEGEQGVGFVRRERGVTWSGRQPGGRPQRLCGRLMSRRAIIALKKKKTLRTDRASGDQPVLKIHVKAIGGLHRGVGCGGGESVRSGDDVEAESLGH